MDFSIMTTCDRYLQRLNVALGNWIHQDYPSDRYEILVSSSEPEDGVRNYLSNVIKAYPEKKIEVVENPPMRTKLEYQESLLARASGRVVVLVDSDMVFPTNFLRHVTDLEIGDGICVWLGRAYLTQQQTYQVILGDRSLRDPAAFRRPLRDGFCDCAIYENGPSGYCHVYTRKTFDDSNGFDGIVTEYGRYGVFASRLLKKMEARGTLREYRKIEDFVAFHLWHGNPDDRTNWNGSRIFW